MGNLDYINCVDIMGGQQSSIGMDVKRINQGVDKKEKERMMK